MEIGRVASMRRPAFSGSRRIFLHPGLTRSCRNKGGGAPPPPPHTHTFYTHTHSHAFSFLGLEAYAPSLRVITLAYALLLPSQAKFQIDATVLGSTVSSRNVPAPTARRLDALCFNIILINPAGQVVRWKFEISLLSYPGARQS